MPCTHDRGPCRVCTLQSHPQATISQGMQCKPQPHPHIHPLPHHMSDLPWALLAVVCQLDTSLSTYIARSYAALEELDWNTADHYLVNAVHAGQSKWWTLPDVNGWPQQPLMQVRGDLVGQRTGRYWGSQAHVTQGYRPQASVPSASARRQWARPPSLALRQGLSTSHALTCQTRFPCVAVCA